MSGQRCHLGPGESQPKLLLKIMSESRAIDLQESVSMLMDHTTTSEHGDIPGQGSC